MIVIILIFLVTVGYYLLRLNYQYWERRGVKGPKPSFLVGNLGKAFTLKSSPGQIYASIYNQYQDEQLVGIYRATTPVLLLRDPELIKEVVAKAFSHFQNNDVYITKQHDPLFGRNPVCLKGEEWKTVRAQMTPAFTSGKMKSVYPLLEENCKNIIKFLESRPELKEGKGYEAKELCIKFTLDNVTSCGFGIDAKCLEDENSTFRKMALEITAPDSSGIFAFFLLHVFPKISKIIKIRLFNKSVTEQMVKIVSETLKYREENNIVRHDFLHIMNELKKTIPNFEDIDVAAHAAGFFGDGYETSAGVMSFALFDLAANPDAQNRLREEITTAVEENGGKLTYEVLQSLAYLEAVLNESLRLHPMIFSLQKVCTKSYTFTLKNTNKPLTVEEGTPVILPVYGLHLDSKYYEDPKTFSPERFLGENKNNLTKYTHLPFGEGPRACLGQRFGLLQVKIGIVSIIRNYELSVNKKTQLPLKYVDNNAITTAAGGLWLNFKKIE